jgi:hypothetical protein
LLGALEAAPDGGVRFKAGGDPIRWRILGDGDPYDQVLSLNIHRRHLTAEQKRDLIAKLLKAKPAASNNSIAKQVKVDDKTVGTVRRELERRSEIPNVKARTDSKGRKQPANKSKPKKAEATTRPKAGPEVPGILEEYSSAIEAGGRTGNYVILYRAVFGPFDSEEEAQRWAQARYPHAGRWDDKEEETEPEPPAVVQPTPSVNGNDIDSGESAKAMKAAHAAQENDGLDIPECLRR